MVSLQFWLKRNKVKYYFYNINPIINFIGFFCCLIFVFNSLIYKNMIKRKKNNYVYDIFLAQSLKSTQ